jgi:schlafen family protein
VGYMNYALKTKRDRWTEEEVLALPKGEPDAFDRKSGDLLLKRDELDKKLGKALSAFANTGGGHLLLGVRDDGTFDGAPQMQGKTTTREWLEQKIPALLDYPLQHFAVHEVVPASPSAIPAGKVVIVIDVIDSPLAPHQSVSDHVYYQRVGGHSMPASHFNLKMLWQRETYPSNRIVRAWFDTMINPLIDGLTNEHRTICGKGWDWDRFTRTIGGLRHLSSLSVNLDQFFLSYPDVRDLLRSHDNAILQLIDRVSALHEAIRDSAELRRIYEAARTPEMLRKMVEAYPHNSVFNNSNDEQILKSVLGPDEPFRLATLAQAIVNETGEILPASGVNYAPFWNLHRETLIEIVRSGPLGDVQESAKDALGKLDAAIDLAKHRLEDIREELGRRHGEPYVAEAPSHEGAYSGSGFLKRY